MLGPVKRRGLTLAGLAVACVVALAGCSAAPAATERSSPTASPTPDPDVAAAEATIMAFKSLIARPDLGFHLEQAATVVQRGGSTDTKYVLDISGRDVKAAITAAGTTVDLVIVDHATWVRERGHAWQQGKNADNATISQIADPWQYLGSLDQLAFAGRVDGNPTRYRYRSTGPIPYQTAMLEKLNAPGSIDALELILDADGTPVEYSFHASARPLSGGLADLALDMTSKVEISRVGKPVAIKPPK